MRVHHGLLSIVVVIIVVRNKELPLQICAISGATCPVQTIWVRRESSTADMAPEIECIVTTRITCMYGFEISRVNMNMAWHISLQQLESQRVLCSGVSPYIS